MRIKFLLVFFLCLSGCQKPYQAEFIQVVRNHNKVTDETCKAIINSIDDRLLEMNLTIEEIKELQNLKDRLIFMDSSAAVIERYLLETKIDESLLQELLKHVWRGEN